MTSRICALKAFTKVSFSIAIASWTAYRTNLGPSPFDSAPRTLQTIKFCKNRELRLHCILKNRATRSLGFSAICSSSRQLIESKRCVWWQFYRRSTHYKIEIFSGWTWNKVTRPHNAPFPGISHPIRLYTHTIVKYELHPNTRFDSLELSLYQHMMYTPTQKTLMVPYAQSFPADCNLRTHALVTKAHHMRSVTCDLQYHHRSQWLLLHLFIQCSKNQLAYVQYADF